MENTSISLVKFLFNKIYIPIASIGNDNINDGIVKSLRYLISQENFI